MGAVFGILHFIAELLLFVVGEDNALLSYQLCVGPCVVDDARANCLL